MIASIAIVRVLEWTPGTAGIGWMVTAWTWNVRSGIRWVSPDPAGVSSNVYGLFIYSLYACIHTYIIITPRAPHYACMHAFIHIYIIINVKGPLITGLQEGPSRVSLSWSSWCFINSLWTVHLLTACMHSYIYYCQCQRAPNYLVTEMTQPENPGMGPLFGPDWSSSGPVGSIHDHLYAQLIHNYIYNIY